MKKLIITLLVLAALAAGIWYLINKNKTPDAQFITAPVAIGNITQSVTATGDLQPLTTVDVSSQISGLIEKVLVDYNTTVKEGDLLAKLDPATYKSRLAQAKAQFANSQANHQLVQLNAQRTKALFDKNLVSQQDLDQVNAQLAQANAQLLIQQASVDTATTDLERCDIYSPIDGIVLDRLAEVGKTVAASLNAPTLFTLANDLTKMQIHAAVAEADIGSVEVNQTVTFTVDAYPDRQFRGKVSQIRNQPVTVQSVVTYTTIIDVKNDDLKLKPGMTANVSIIIAKREKTLRVPNSALRVRIPDSLLPAASTTGTTEEQPVADRATIDKLMRELGINPSAGRRNMAPTDRARLVARAKELHIKLPPYMINPASETSGITTRTLYLLEGTPEKPAVKPVTVKLGITDGSNTEVIEGLKEGDNLITTSLIPNNSQRLPLSDSPFAGGRRR